MGRVCASGAYSFFFSRKNVFLRVKTMAFIKDYGYVDSGTKESNIRESKQLAVGFVLAIIFILVIGYFFLG